jgi:hypothetical protein
MPALRHHVVVKMIEASHHRRHKSVALLGRFVGRTTVHIREQIEQQHGEVPVAQQLDCVDVARRRQVDRWCARSAQVVGPTSQHHLAVAHRTETTEHLAEALAEQGVDACGRSEFAQHGAQLADAHPYLVDVLVAATRRRTRGSGTGIPDHLHQAHTHHLAGGGIDRHRRIEVGPRRAYQSGTVGTGIAVEPQAMAHHPSPGERDHGKRRAPNQGDAQQRHIGPSFARQAHHGATNPTRPRPTPHAIDQLGLGLVPASHLPIDRIDTCGRDPQDDLERGVVRRGHQSDRTAFSAGLP